MIVPTRNRPAALGQTLATLLRQTIDRRHYEVIVVDDGSTPPATVAADGVRCVRLDGVERSAARNAGAHAASAPIIAFVDDDISVEPAFLDAHLRAHDDWPCALAVGSIRLPEETQDAPFGRFRQRLEDRNVPIIRGPVTARNFCTAANMSMNRARFEDLGGFDEELAAAEDQDLALRHTARDGMIVFIPEARTVHRDNALDLRTYCRRVEHGSEAMVAFCRRHPTWPENVDRERVNGAIRWNPTTLDSVFRKAVKQAIASTPALSMGFALAALLERAAPRSVALERLYRLVLGACILRGYRRGVARFGSAMSERNVTTAQSR